MAKITSKKIKNKIGFGFLVAVSVFSVVYGIYKGLSLFKNGKEKISGLSKDEECNTNAETSLQDAENQNKANKNQGLFSSCGSFLK